MKIKTKFFKIFVFLIIVSLISFFYFSCQTTKTETKKTEETNQIQEDQNNKEENNEVKEEKKEETQEPQKLVNKEFDGIIFENVPENIDLTQIKSELEKFFLNYEKVVLSKNYDEWLNMISPGYYKKYNSLDYLKKINATAYGIYNIKQYFFRVVYESRIRLNNGEPLKIYKIIFKKNDLTRAIVLVKFENKLLKYYFIKSDANWKISTSEEFFNE